MPGSTFGTLFKVTTFGESHGPAMGCVIDGCPAGLFLDLDFLQKELDRRRPGQSAITTQRKESDIVQVLSGVFEGFTTGAPLALLIPNEDARSQDYDHLTDAFRPHHADYTWWAKYGRRDHRGGGRAGARETAARVAAGAVAKLLLRHISREQGLEGDSLGAGWGGVQAYVSQVGPLILEKNYPDLDLSLTETNPVRCPDPALAAEMEKRIRQVRKDGDTIGGVVSCVVRGCPPGLGEPVFDKLHADLGKAMLSIPAAKGFEYGSGFAGVTLRGSEHNQQPTGGALGGISDGTDLFFRVAFKPVATLLRDQEGRNAAGEAVIIKGKGRHDPCVVPRAVPIVEAMAALVLADHWLRARGSRV